MILESIGYVTNAYMFWQSMILVMYLGAVIGMAVHNGDVKGATKSVLVALPMALLIAMVHYLRVVPHIATGVETVKTYAGIFTTLFVGGAYIVGFFFGVFLLRYTYRNHVHIK